MPYGVDKKLGGDSKENDAWMERCVTSVMKGGKEKSNAIAICKSQMKKMHEKKENKAGLDEIVIDYDIITRADTIRNRVIRQLMQKGNTFEDAKALYGGLLARSNYDLDALPAILSSIM